MARKKKYSVPEEFTGGILVTDRLDLHGLFPEEIPEIMDAFIANALNLGLNTVKVIHGKGKSRLKWEVIQFLKTDPRVTGYRDAPPQEGGWGATTVVLK